MQEKIEVGLEEFNGFYREETRGDSFPCHFVAYAGVGE